MELTSVTSLPVKHYPSVDVMVLIKSAHEMWENDFLEQLRAKRAATAEQQTAAASGTGRQVCRVHPPV